MFNCRKDLKIICVILALLISLGCLTAGATTDLQPSSDFEDPIADYTFSRAISSDEVFVFGSGSFDLSKSEKATAVSIIGLPDEQVGKLLYNGREVLPYEKIKRKNFDKLTFVPAKDCENKDAVLTFKAELSGDGATVNTMYTINVAGEYNYPPMAENVKLVTQRDMPITGWFAAKDVENEPLTYTIVSDPKKGEVTLNSELLGAFNYKPYPNKTGTDKFTYRVTDKSGNVSNIATVTIKINKPDSEIFYHDLEGNGAHYAAIKLAEEGALVGQKVGNSMVFQPNTTISRGAFLVTLMETAGLADDLPVPAATMFADDDSIPAWMKSYVNKAVEAGIVKGSYQQDGRLCFNPDKPVTKAEAVVMMNAVVSCPAAEVSAQVFGDMDAIPAWSVSSFVDLEQIGVLHCFADGSIRAGDNLTRIQAVQLLYDMKNYQTSADADKSFIDRFMKRGADRSSSAS